MQVISLNNLINSTEEIEEVEDYLKTFKCVKNGSVETYLHSKAILNEKSRVSRTSLIIDENNHNDIIGFTILIKSFNFTTASGKNRKKLGGNKSATSFQTILIAKIGRADAYKGIVSGSKVLELTLENCKLIDELSAIRIVCVEYEDIPYLKTFYPENGFTELQKNETNLNISFLRLE